MIAIINISKNPTKTGWNTYSVGINRDVITTFKHKREDGLARCLELAASAVRIAEYESKLR